MKKINNIKDTGFKTPPDYFNSFEDNLMAEINLKRKVSTNGFVVPETYFDSLENNVIDSLDKSTKVIPLFNKKAVLYISGIAAAILLFFNLSISEEQITFDNLDLETAENYIIDENISSYELAALMDEDLLDDNFIEYNFNEETIETYLLNNMDIDDLMVE